MLVKLDWIWLKFFRNCDSSELNLISQLIKIPLTIFSFLGVKCDSWIFITSYIRYMDGVYVLFSRNSHLGSHNRYNLRGIMSENHRTSVGSASNIYIFCCCQLFCSGFVLALLFSSLRNHKKHGNFIRCENSRTHRIFGWTMRGHDASYAKFTYC